MIGDDPPDTPGATGGSHRRWTGLEKFLAVAAAAFTLATAVLTLITTEVNSDRQQARSSAVTAGSDLTNLQSRYDALQAQHSRLESQNQEYRSRLASTTPATSQPPPGGAGAQLGTYHFDLIGGREVPLGADPPTQAQVLAGNQGDIMWRSDLGGEPLFPGTSEQIVLLSPRCHPDLPGLVRVRIAGIANEPLNLLRQDHLHLHLVRVPPLGPSGVTQDPQRRDDPAVVGLGDVALVESQSPENFRAHSAESSVTVPIGSTGRRWQTRCGRCAGCDDT